MPTPHTVCQARARHVDDMAPTNPLFIIIFVCYLCFLPTLSKETTSYVKDDDAQIFCKGTKPMTAKECCQTRYIVSEDRTEIHEQQYV